MPGTVAYGVRWQSPAGQQEALLNGQTAVAAPERDGTPSLAALETAITGWASARMNAAPAPLYIVLVNHGSIGAFHIGRDLLTPTALDRMLDTLQDVKLTDPVARQQQVVVVLGSCHSGSFIRTLSANKRIVIAAADTWESSYRGASQAGELNPDGEYFVSTLFHELTRTDNSLFAAFQVAADAARERAICTTPVAPPSGPLWIQDSLSFQHCVNYVIANGDDTYTYRFTSASRGGVPRPMTHIVFELPAGVSLVGAPSSQYSHAWSVGPDAATGVTGVRFLADATYRLGAQLGAAESEWFQFTVGKFVEKVTNRSRRSRGPGQRRPRTGQRAHQWQGCRRRDGPAAGRRKERTAVTTEEYFLEVEVHGRGGIKLTGVRLNDGSEEFADALHLHPCGKAERPAVGRAHHGRSGGERRGGSQRHG